MKITTTRSRGAAAFVASLTLLGGAASIVTTPASAEPGNCDTTFPMAGFDGLVDQPVTTKTVVRGTEPQDFTGTVLGKIDGGIAPGVDMIMVDFSSLAGDTAIDENGIWAGMSGSPVYTADGELLGAVAYGLAWGPSPIAGVTPYENMDDYAPASPAREVQVGAAAARAIASESDVTRSQAQEGFAQLPMSMGFSGLTQQRVKQLKKKGPDYLHTRGMRAAGAASAAVDAGPEDLVAGGNLGAAISYGDITAGGVGTVTSVCDDWLIGFGHPMTYGGRTSLGLMPADAIYVQKDLIASFKVANMGTPAGTILQDRLTGISGTVGDTPDETDVTSTVVYGDRDRTGSSASLVQDYNADITLSQILANHDVVVDAIQGGTEDATFTVEGTDADGAPFTIEFGDRYTSEWDISFESIWDVADVMWVMSSMQDVTVTSVEATADVTDDTSMYRLRKVEQKRGSEWVTVNRRRAVKVVPGGTVRLRATIANVDGSSTVPLTIDVPKRTSRGGYLEVVGGASMWNSDVYGAETPAEMAQALESMARNDQVVANLNVTRGDAAPAQDVSDAQDLVVRGGKYIDVRIVR
jgi:hypothetical protein